MNHRPFRRCLAAACAVLLAAGCGKPPPGAGPDTSGAKAAIDAANRSFSELVARGDSAGIAQLYAADAMALPANSEAVSGNAEIAKLFKAFIDAGLRGLKLDTVSVDVGGDLAVETGNYELTDANGGHMDHGKYVVTWKQEGGSWKIYRDIWTTSMPAPVAEPATGPPGSSPDAPAPFGS